MKEEKYYQDSAVKATDLERSESGWLSDLAQMTKLRLNLLVVFSTLFAALIASVGVEISWVQFVYLGVGGFLTTGASLIFNQVFEKSYDAKMKRTENRPLPANRISRNKAILIAGGFILVGVSLLAMINALTAFLSVLALVCYSFLYTPLKRITPLAVHFGAIPGAMPVLIGVVAITGSINTLAVILFTIQFFWQFSHFWAIAWVSHDDYTRAGFKLLPSKNNEKTREVGLHAALYTFVLIPASLLLFILPGFSAVSVGLVTLVSALYLYQAIELYRKADDKAARSLMYGSFMYLPLVLIILYIGVLL